MIENSLSRKILTVGPEYAGYRGGIGAVLDIYSKNFDPFNFLATYPPEKLKMRFKAIPTYAIACIKLMFILFTKREVEIVHIHVAAKGSFFRKYGIFLLTKYLFKKKVIFHSHGSEMMEFYFKRKGILKIIFRHFINCCDCIICLSLDWKEFYLRNFNQKNIVLLENIIEKPALDFGNIPIVDNSVISFLFLGFIGARKGIFDVIDLIKDKKDELVGRFKLFVAGNGEIEKLIYQIDLYGLNDIVYCLGWVGADRKIELLKVCDVYLLPSYNEGLPISILEAMSYGKSIVSTCVGGISDVVKNDFNGFLVEPGDKEALWEVIKRFVSQPTLAYELGINSLKLIEAYFSDNVIVKLAKIYEDLLEPANE